MRYDDPNVPMSAVVAIVSAVLVVISILLLESLYYRMSNAEFERKIVAPPNEALGLRNRAVVPRRFCACKA